MGRRLNLTHLSDEECERILQVIQRDFDIRQKEKERLSKIEEEIKEEESKSEILSKQRRFNENHCMRCFSRFIFLFNSKVKCALCHFNVCKTCAPYDKEKKQYICTVCSRQKVLTVQACDWFYENVKRKFKRFGSAKVVRSLYKRKTDSDSENDSAYHSTVYNSLPGGLRQRQSVQGFFASQNAWLQQEMLSEEAERMSSNGGELSQHPAGGMAGDSYQPCTCSIAGPKETQAALQDSGVRNRLGQLDKVILDFQKELDRQSRLGTAQTDGSSGYEKVLDSYRTHISNSLASLTQSLHVAIETHSRTDAPVSPSEVHQHVKHVLANEVEQFTGSPVDLGDEPTSENTSEDGSTSGYYSQHSHEDIMAEAIVRKIVEDQLKYDQEQNRREEAEVRRAFTKLSNRATVAQLADLLSDTETEDPESSAQTSELSSSRLEDSTDGDSVTQGISASLERDFDRDSDIESVKVTPLTGDSKDHSSDQSPRTKHLKKRSSYRNSESVDSDLDGLDMDRLSGSDSDLDDLIKNNSFDSREQQEDQTRGKSRSKRKQKSQQKSDIEITLTTPEGETKAQKHKRPIGSQVSSGSEDVFFTDSDIAAEHKGEENGNAEEELKQMAAAQTVRAVAIPRGTVENIGSQSDSDHTLEGNLDSPCESPVSEPTINRRMVIREAVYPDLEEEYSSLEFVQRHEVPLPSLDSDLGRKEIDLDDISRRSSDNEDEEDFENSSTMQSEITYGTPFGSNPALWNRSALFDRRNISPYDNLGEKKVGRDIEGPVIMFVPQAREDVVQSPTVGNKNVEELSDLSENDSVSGHSSESEDDYLNEYKHQDKYDFGNKTEKDSTTTKMYMRTDSGVQTEDIPVAMGSSHTETSTMTETSGTTAEGVENNNNKDIPQEFVNKAIILARRKSRPDLFIDEETMERYIGDKSDQNAESVTGQAEEDTDPKFVVRPENVTIPEGELARFTCEVDGTDPIAVTWYHVFWYKDMADVHEIEEDETYELSNHGNKYTLEIFNCGRSQQGHYLCIAINDIGQVNSSMKLTVTGAATEKAAPEFLKQVQDVEVMEGASVKFRCKLKGYPQPRVLWYKDGKKLKNSDHYRMEKFGNRDYLLTIDCSTLDDDAEYSVVARNIAGEARCQAQLIVEANPNAADEDHSRLDSLDSLYSHDSYTYGMKKATHPETRELLELAEKVVGTQNTVTNTAEDFIQTAGELSSIHEQLDEMDRKLNNLEGQVHEAISPQADSVISDDDCTNNNSGYSSLRDSYRDSLLKDHNEMKSAASAVRQVTSSALEVLSTAVDAIRVERENLDLKSERTTETASVEPVSMFKRKLEPPEPEETSSDEEDLILSYEEFERLYEKGKLTKDQIRTGKVKHKDMNRLREFLQAEGFDGHTRVEDTDDTSHDLIVPTEFQGTVDCGLKRVSSKRYKRDYVVNSSSRNLQKKWDVKMPSAEGTEIVRCDSREHDDTEEQIYMTASKVFSLEERIRHLEGSIEATDEDTSADKMADLEDQVALAVAKVAQTEQEVCKVEQSLVELQEQASSPDALEPVAVETEYSVDLSELDKVSSVESHSEDSNLSPRSHGEKEEANVVALHGGTQEEDIPDSRGEFDEDLELPSVKRLMKKFNSNYEVVRVCSLTARDLPKTVRDKLRTVSPIMAGPIRSNKGHTDSGKPADASAFVASPTEEIPRFRPVYEIFPSPDMKVTPSSKSTVIDDKAESSVPEQAALLSTSSSLSPLVDTNSTCEYRSKTLSDSCMYEESKGAKSDFLDSRDSQEAPAGATGGTIVSYARSVSVESHKKSDPPKRNRNSAIMARAAFWDNRVIKGEVRDEDASLQFPTMSDDSFKK